MSEFKDFLRNKLFPGHKGSVETKFIYKKSKNGSHNIKVNMTLFDMNHTVGDKYLIRFTNDKIISKEPQPDIQEAFSKYKQEICQDIIDELSGKMDELSKSMDEIVSYSSYQQTEEKNKESSSKKRFEF